MIPNDFSVGPANWDADIADLRAVRTPVFVIEQNVPPEDEWDEDDARSQHVIARDAQGLPIGTGRLTPRHTIGRMAVVRDWRGKGVGAALLRVLLERARELRYPAIELHAQTHAIAFYSRFGFEVCGNEFDECGIAHRIMRLDLSVPSQREPAPLAPAPAAHSLASSDRDEAVAAILQVVAGARRELALRTRDLDPAVLDRADVVEAIKRVALSGRGARIRILVQEPARPASEGHQLLTLAQRLSSVFEFRTPIDEIDHQFAGAYVLNDRGGWFQRPLASRFDGDGSTYAPSRHAQLLGAFDATWERSEPSVELRRIEI